MKHLITFFVVALVVGIGFQTVTAATIAEQQKGYILLQVEKNGEAWYVYPKDLKRYFLGRPDDAFSIMRKLGLGISNANLEKIPVSTSSATGDTKLRQQLSGYILLQVEKNGEAWYVYPGNLKRYYLGRPADAFSIMRNLGKGITNSNLSTIPLGTLSGTTSSAGISYTKRSVVSTRGTYTVSQLTLDRTKSSAKIMTDTGNSGNCSDNCTAMSLGSYVSRRSGVAGIHGTYFCPPEYADCGNQSNFYYYPVFNSFTRKMINQDRVKFTPEPMMVFDTTNKPIYVNEARDFDTLVEFEEEQGIIVRSAITNGPALVEAGVNVVNPATLDSKQATVKSYRGALGYKGDVIYFFIVHNATVTDSGAVADAMGLDYAINLDGGGSTALYNSGSYILGPGRDLPNAIVITQ